MAEPGMNCRARARAASVMSAAPLRAEVAAFLVVDKCLRTLGSSSVVPSLVCRGVDGASQ